MSGWTEKYESKMATAWWDAKRDI